MTLNTTLYIRQGVLADVAVKAHEIHVSSREAMQILEQAKDGGFVDIKSVVGPIREKIADAQALLDAIAGEGGQD